MLMVILYNILVGTITKYRIYPNPFFEKGCVSLLIVFLFAYKYIKYTRYKQFIRI